MLTRDLFAVANLFVCVFYQFSPVENCKVPTAAGPDRAASSARCVELRTIHTARVAQQCLHENCLANDSEETMAT